MSKERNQGAIRGRDTAINNGQSSGWKNGSNGTKYKSSRDGGGNVKHERVSSSGRSHEHSGIKGGLGGGIISFFFGDKSR